MTVPDDLLLAFFGESSSRLLEMDAGEAMASASDKNAVISFFGLDDCRRCVLDQQILVLKEVTDRYRDESSSDDITATRVQERLGRLQQEPNLSQELKGAMETMNDAARMAVCKLALYCEEGFVKTQSSTSSRTLQDEGRLDRTKLMEYFGLCQAALKLPCVTDFMVEINRDRIFDARQSDGDQTDETNTSSSSSSSSSSAMVFPQSRLEYVQRLLAKAIGWDPVFVTSELRTIFVERPGEVDSDYYDEPVVSLFQKLVEEMMVAIRSASLQLRAKQDTELLNDLGKGGSTRVVSMQYSEFDVDQNGNRIESSQTNAPESTVDEREEDLSEEEKKRQLRLASEAAILQQTILGELLSMSEEERTDKLNQAAEASRKFMEEAMALPPGQERVDFLRGMDATTSRQLAMHKLWTGMLQANGGQPPKIVRQK
mmetsp:Transcript_25890/g.60942  ORF Transcript_25890/g.60942 Transcript_25890/m.60942 type:complete len:429 (+) Transcript_25890:139-1425(+)|eukprot:CAMPEP_0172387180 /NCGR_PEP_ID=MMETSP1061-20121228/4537_1 /TAXON_ID=37318 /ORGANISM="Pseudo-nitzschia pungens, Strain cf. pungens" /LENGTH=428 /DNA_ID=CAMNT_0013116751 /DNA_START=91 /DNA_END=1377 /DNA_ORIENTATION=-